MEDVSSWPNKKQAQELLGISERTLDRYVNLIGVRRAERPALGRKPETVLDPAGIEDIQQRLASSRGEVIETPPRQLPAKLQPANQPLATLTNGHVSTIQTNGHAPAIRLNSHHVANQVDSQPSSLPPAFSQAVTEYLAGLTGPRYVTLKEAKSLTGLPATHLVKAQLNGRPLGKRVSRQWRFHRGDLMAYRLPDAD